MSRRPARPRKGDAAAAPLPASWFAALVGLAIAVGIARIVALAWISDDAYISFRYADNLNRGLGLVFNAGERVEGYSNFLWTLWCALGLKLGAPPEAWANTSGAACWVLTVMLLAAFTRSGREARRGPGLPIAALLAACHTDWLAFATGGLETAAYTMLVALGFVLLAGALDRRARLAGAGAVFGLVALTRPEGILFAAVGGAWLVWVEWRSGRIARLPTTALAYGAPLVAIVAPFALWKLAYYGDLRPNTYYAKSASLAWWSQGFLYLGLYLQKYWALALAPLLLLVPRRGPRQPAAAKTRGAAGAQAPALEAAPSFPSRAASLAVALSVAYVLFVLRVGGDFMFARFFVPVVPLLLILIELGIEHALPADLGWHGVATAAAAAALIVTPAPISGHAMLHGIANERDFYDAAERAKSRAEGLALRRYFAGLPVRVAFYGMQAIHAYYSRASLAIECATGLTDSAVAHQRLTQRFRVGHEKPALFSYLIDRRHVHFSLGVTIAKRDSLLPYVPVQIAQFDSAKAFILTWDPPLMRELARRGARFADFEAELDAYLADVDRMPDTDVRATYEHVKRAYFDATPDSAREAIFLARLARSHGPP